MVTINQLSYPEAQLWAVVPKQEWDKAATMKENLELLEKAVVGQSMEESIAELKSEGKRMEADSGQDQLDRLVERLEELNSQGNLEISSEKTTETSQMTLQELSRAERQLLFPNQES